MVRNLRPLHYILLTLLCSAILFEPCVLAQNNCELPIPENILIIDVDNQLPAESDPNIVLQLDNISYNCLTHAENPTFLLYAGVSIEYSRTGNTPGYFRAVYRCGSGSIWTNTDINSSSSIAGSEPFLSSTYRRENCSTCSLTAPEDYLCVPCNETCLDTANSLGYCYGSDSTECCNFILNGTCTIACPVNFEANSSNVCVCQNQWVGALCDQCPIGCVNGTQNANCTSCDCIAGFEGDLCNAEINECDPIPCANNGTCTDVVNNFTCDCANSWIGRTCDVCPLECGNGTQSSNCSICICDPGYTGERCEIDIDDCSMTPCANGGNCSDRVNNFTCSCSNFWDGRTCDTCSLGCVNGAQSVNCTECLCEAGFSGQLCDVDINECEPSPCLNNGTCQDQVNNYTCTCIDGWVGRNCSDCGLTCFNGSYSSDCSSCICDPGYTGGMCETDINECIPNLCMNNGTCQDLVNNYTCTCTNEWVGRNCSDCSLTCINGVQGADCSSCECTVGFNGIMCEVNIDDCLTSPCLNSGTCEDQVNSFNCICIHFWIGDTCDDCPLNCTFGTQESDCSMCNCSVGFSGTETCNDINECTEQTQPCPENANCNNTFGGFECPCINSFTGSQCDQCPLVCGNGTYSTECSSCVCTSGYTGGMCETDINECIPFPCLNNGTCQDLVNNYTCTCIDGWVGRNCSDCGLTCFNGSYSSDCSSCICDPGYTGGMCETDINECIPNPCMNNGTCQDQVNNYTCTCIDGWVGRNCSDCGLTCFNGSYSSDCSSCICDPGYKGGMCETDINECIPNPCMNNGTCQDLVNNYTCTCTNEWVGRNCSECSLTCSNGVPSDSCSMCICDAILDPCEPNPCRHGGECVSNGTAYECLCLPGYIAENCGVGVYTCNTSDTCNLGACVEATMPEEIEGVPPSYCVCPPSYIGEVCDELISGCVSGACQNGGRCDIGRNVLYNLNFTCACSAPFSGPNCQLCPLDGLCENNGVRSADCSRCICQFPYAGSYCRDSGCPGGQVIDDNKCKDACSTNNYQPSAANKEICSACGIDNCVQCDKGGGVCTECGVGYQAVTKECVRILLGCGIANCERCYAGICTVCVTNYSLTLDNGCQQVFDKEDTSANVNNHLAIILGSVAAVAVLCIILAVILIGTGVGVVYYKKLKKDAAYAGTTQKEEIEFTNPVYLSSIQASSKQDLIKSLF